MILFASSTLAGLLLAGGSTTTVTVGADGSCDFNTITAAVTSAPGNDTLEMRVAKNINVTGIQSINGRDAIIRGGYDNCSDSTPSGRTVLSGATFVGSVLSITGSAPGNAAYSLTMIDLEINGGNAAGDGGGITIDGRWIVTGHNLYIHTNSAATGGGVWVETPGGSGATSSFTLVDSLLIGNNASNGGGIGCFNAEVASIRTGITNNTATQNGGGLHGISCTLEVGESGELEGVLANLAGALGGGIHAEIGSDVRINGSGTDPALVVGNSATDGGGISVDLSLLTITNGVVSGNTATDSGGGVHGVDATITTDRTLTGAACHDPARCTVIAGNSANGGGADSGGGGLWVMGGSLDIRETYVEDNSAGAGSALRARYVSPDAPAPAVNIYGSVFATNTGAPQVVLIEQSGTDASYSTFTDNTDASQVFEIRYLDATLFQTLFNANIFEHVGSSVLSVKRTTAKGLAPEGSCNRIEGDPNDDLFGRPSSTSALPLFVDPGQSDYRLAEFSPLVDYCIGLDGSSYTANGLDRPYDVITIPDNIGPFDLGGIEFQPEDLIFASDFGTD